MLRQVAYCQVYLTHERIPSRKEGKIDKESLYIVNMSTLYTLNIYT